MAWDSIAQVGGPSISINSNLIPLFFNEITAKMVYALDLDGKILWFEKRMEVIYLNPLKELLDFNSEVNRNIRTENQDAMLSVFSILLNGIETFGSFIVTNNDRDVLRRELKGNKARFYIFIRDYMPNWNKSLNEEIKVYSDNGLEIRTCNDLYEILWINFRNCLAHGFNILNGGIIHTIEGQYLIDRKTLIINPIIFLQDLEAGIIKYFCDVKENSNNELRNTFLKRFEVVYPLSNTQISDTP